MYNTQSQNKLSFYLVWNICIKFYRDQQTITQLLHENLVSPDNDDTINNEDDNSAKPFYEHNSFAVAE